MGGAQAGCRGRAKGRTSPGLTELTWDRAWIHQDTALLPKSHSTVAGALLGAEEGECAWPGPVAADGIVTSDALGGEGWEGLLPCAVLLAGLAGIVEGSPRGMGRPADEIPRLT